MVGTLASNLTTKETSHLQLTATTPLSDGMRQFKKRTHFLSVHRPELTRKYPDQWVGLSCNGTLISGPTIQAVLDKVESKGLNRQGLAVKLMATKPRRLIL